MFLQTYHHAGVVLTMWAMCVSAEATVFVCVCLNSFIHTIMYTYYAFSALGYSWSLKNVLTQAQVCNCNTKTKQHKTNKKKNINSGDALLAAFLFFFCVTSIVGII